MPQWPILLESVIDWSYQAPFTTNKFSNLSSPPLQFVPQFGTDFVLCSCGVREYNAEQDRIVATPACAMRTEHRLRVQETSTGGRHWHIQHGGHAQHRAESARTRHRDNRTARKGLGKININNNNNNDNNNNNNYNAVLLHDTLLANDCTDWWSVHLCIILIFKLPREHIYRGLKNNNSPRLQRGNAVAFLNTFDSSSINQSISDFLEWPK